MKLETKYILLATLALPAMVAVNTTCIAVFKDNIAIVVSIVISTGVAGLLWVNRMKRTLHKKIKEGATK